MSMLGVGVGFDMLGRGKVSLHALLDAIPHSVGDREKAGVRPSATLLRAFFTGGQAPCL